MGRYDGSELSWGLGKQICCIDIYVNVTLYNFHAFIAARLRMVSKAEGLGSIFAIRVESVIHGERNDSPKKMAALRSCVRQSVTL